MVYKEVEKRPALSIQDLSSHDVSTGSTLLTLQSKCRLPLRDGEAGASSWTIEYNRFRINYITITILLHIRSTTILYHIRIITIFHHTLGI